MIQHSILKWYQVKYGTKCVAYLSFYYLSFCLDNRYTWAESDAKKWIYIRLSIKSLFNNRMGSGTLISTIYLLSYMQVFGFGQKMPLSRDGCIDHCNVGFPWYYGQRRWSSTLLGKRPTETQLITFLSHFSQAFTYTISNALPLRVVPCFLKGRQWKSM